MEPELDACSWVSTVCCSGLLRGQGDKSPHCSLLSESEDHCPLSPALEWLHTVSGV